MCFGFVGKTFNLPSSAPAWMRHKQKMNKNFHKKVLPKFRQRQSFLAQHGQGMLIEQEGIEVERENTNNNSNFRNSLARKNNSNNYLGRDDSWDNNQRQLTSQRGGSSTSLYSNKNPSLSINQREVRAALSEARRSRNNSSNGNLMMLGKSVNKR